MLALAAAPQAPGGRNAEATFEVATIKPVDHDPQGGRYFRMTDAHRFVARDYTLKLLIAAAFDVSPKVISGGPNWLESEHFDIHATTPGETQPSRAVQMAMLRHLLTERFGLTFHREQREYSIYELTVANKPKLKESSAPPDEPAALISTVYPQRIVLPARNATMDEFASLLQRAVLDRPVANKTGLTGRFDFTLEWAPDETQFGGDVPIATADAPAAPLFTAIQEQLGLKLQATRGDIAAFIVDGANRPLPN